MAMTPRLLAPVAEPPPPKPPQLNLVASSLMPDVDTDTFGPDDGPSLAASIGLHARVPVGSDRTLYDIHPGESAYSEVMEYRNGLIAAVGVMSEMELKQVEQDAGVTVDSLPKSIFAATSSEDRWTGGFAYAPENQYAGILADPCGQVIDLPYLSPQNGLAAPAGPAATPSITGGHLTAAASPYSYVVAAVGITGGQGTPTAAFTGTIASGIVGSNALAWSAVTGAASYNVYGRFPGSYQLIANVTGTSFTDTGAAAPTLAGQSENLPQVGFIPFLIQVQDTASAFGWEVRDYVGRAMRLLDNATPNALERELWTGTFAQNTETGPMYQSDFPGGLNAFFQQTGTIADGGSALAAVDLTPGSSGGGGTPCSITRGIQILEDYLANTGFGGQGMLHVAPETSPNLLGARRVGSLLLSVMDNIIVPGSGYPTSGSTGPIGNSSASPGAGNAWIYATDLVSVRLDDPMFWPSTMAEATDRGNFASPNTVRIRAQRAGAATWDQSRLAGCRVALST